MYLSELVIYFLLIITIIATFRNPFNGVVAYYFLSFYRPQDVYWWALGGSRLSFYVAIVTIFCFIFRKYHSKEIEKQNYVFEDALMFLFWIQITFSYLLSANRVNSWPVFIDISKIILFYFVLTNLVTTKKRFTILIWVAIVSFGLHAIWANDHYLSGIVEYDGHVSGPGLPGAGFKDRNVFAMCFVVVIPMMFYFSFLYENILIKFGLYTMMGVAAHAIIVTYSRGAFLGMMMAGAICIWKTPKKLTTSFLLVLAIPAFLKMYGAGSQERISTIFASEEERDFSAQSRIDAWKGGFNMMKAHPFFGVGLWNYKYFVMRYNPEIKKARAAHNAYIQLGGDAGFPAFILLLLLVLIPLFDCFFLNRYFRNKDPTLAIYSNMLFASLCGFFLCSMFLSLERFEPFYFMVSLVACLKKMKISLINEKEIDLPPENCTTCN